MSHNLLLTASYIALFSIWGLSGFVAIPVPVNLIVTSTLILYIGCHRSLRLLATEAEGGKFLPFCCEGKSRGKKTRIGGLLECAGEQ